MKSPRFVIGNIAKGDDLWDRDEVIEEICKGLEKSSVLLKAPRRFGKTSIMWELCENPFKSGLKAVFIDTEGLRNPQEFIARLVFELHAKEILKKDFWGWIKKRIPAIDEVALSCKADLNAEFRIKIKEFIGGDWKEKGNEFISKIKDSDDVLIVLDELPLLIQRISLIDGKDTANDFVFWLRSVRQELSNVRWLVGGSIGIEHILNKIGAGTKAINDFQIVGVGALSEKNGREYIKALLKTEESSMVISEDIIDYILEVIGAPVPYFIQILLKESLHEMRVNKEPLTKIIIDKAYGEGVLGPVSRTYFEHYYARLKEYYDVPLERAAKRLILEVARKGRVSKAELFKLFRQVSEGKLSDDDFSYLMSDIENDFYVSCGRDGSYSFNTNILKDWWLRYYDLVEE